MAGLRERIRNVWSNEMWTSDEARSRAVSVVAEARDQMAKDLINTPGLEPGVASVLRDRAVELWGARLPELAINVMEPYVVGTSDVIHGFASEFQYEIGKSVAGYHFRSEIAPTDGVDVHLSSWSNAVLTPAEAEAGAQKALAEWAKGNLELQAADLAAAKERVGEAEQESTEREIARFERSRGMSVEV